MYALRDLDGNYLYYVGGLMDSKVDGQPLAVMLARKYRMHYIERWVQRSYGPSDTFLDEASISSIENAQYPFKAFIHHVSLYGSSEIQSVSLLAETMESLAPKSEKFKEAAEETHKKSHLRYKIILL
jgi:hypothetical protein